MAFYRDRQLTNLASSVSVFAITIGLVVGQSATLISLAAPSVANGAGATTVNALFTALKSKLQLTYDAVGSGAGLKAFFAQTPTAGIPKPITFADSDDPVAGTEKVTGGRGYVQVPLVGVGITLAFNTKGLTVPAAGLKLSRASYCGILNGSITNWSNKSISADNGGQIALNVPIKVVRRADSSGSTFILSSHLNTACKPAATTGIPAANVWNRGVGTTVNWPSTFIGATGGGGVVTAIASNPGGIGYVDNATLLTYNKVNKPQLPSALLLNKAGKYIAVSPASITAAIKDGKVVKYGTNLTRIDDLTDPKSASSYPISGATYFLYYSDLDFKGFITAAKALAPSLGYGSVP
ncbi:substrate-binding domain-containing protein [Nostoc sp.]|uniref:substrate-binding domain-containing protein n=1 Tax=Nostoc sp. TaxID=1180 RepID=UPI002FF6EA54